MPHYNRHTHTHKHISFGKKNLRIIILFKHFFIFKQYVQDVMRQLSQQIYCDLIERKGHIYVCGDVSMAQDVNKTLQFILQENGIHDADMTLLSLKVCIFLAANNYLQIQISI